MEENGSLFVPSECAVGVPQGFMFGPIFLIFLISDLFGSCNEHAIVFADNTSKSVGWIDELIDGLIG